MPAKGFKNIALREEDYLKVKKIAKRKGMKDCNTVLFALQRAFPNDFPQTIEA
jgi:hypothetical protein